MNRKIAMSMLSIVAALTLMGGATYAAFTSDATNAQNTFASGTLNLSINTVTGISNPVFTSGNASGIAPGQSVTQILTFKNEGTVPASALKVIGFTKNGGTADFEGQINVTFFLDLNTNSVYDAGDTLLGQALMNNAVWNDYALPGIALAGNASQPIGVQLTLDSNTPNTFQGASINFDMKFQAVQ